MPIVTVMKRSIFEGEHHVRPDISNEISWGEGYFKRKFLGGDLDERIDFPLCNVFQVHHPKYLIFWDRRIKVIETLPHAPEKRRDSTVKTPREVSILAGPGEKIGGNKPPWFALFVGTNTENASVG